MFKWLTNKIIDNYIKSKIKKIKEADIKSKVLEYLNEHKEEVIEKIKESVKKLVDKIIKDFKNKVQRQE